MQDMKDTRELLLAGVSASFRQGKVQLALASWVHSPLLLICQGRFYAIEWMIVMRSDLMIMVGGKVGKLMIRQTATTEGIILTTSAKLKMNLNL